MPTVITNALHFSGTFIMLLVLVGMFAAGVHYWRRGTSLGKSLLGLQVRNATTFAPVGFWTMAIRETVGKWLSGLLFGLGWFWILIDKRNQGFHDKLMGTVVIQVDAAATDAGAQEPSMGGNL